MNLVIIIVHAVFSPGVFDSIWGPSSASMGNQYPTWVNASLLAWMQQDA